ncbi:MAG: KEOPS complex subunit Pcc1 [Thermoplasmata archaeon]|nr:KEOPS complex subunit Pcc1 [Thermoplasmata archaeon]
MRKAVVEVETEAAAIVAASLQPEANRAVPRSTVTLTAKRDTLVMAMEASDTSALRATLNSYLRWASGALRMVEEAGA